MTDTRKIQNILKSNVTKKILDPDLAEWLLEKNDYPKELIVKARISINKVSMKKTTFGFSIPHSIESTETSNKENILRELFSFLKNILDYSPILLKASGAIVVKANNKQILKVLEHPLVKRISFNRTIKNINKNNLNQKFINIQ